MTVKHAHITTRVNASQIKRETINGEDHYRIPSATLPDNVVMNDGLYPAQEIESSYRSLEGTPAPLGHPKVGNSFVPASSPHAINKHWVGAWNENVRRQGGRVLLDKVVNIRVANQTEGGRQLIQAIEKQEPIHTSTGLTLQQRTGNGESNGKPYTWIATQMNFDHDAILLGEPGAATPEEGVGMFVNAAGDEAEVLTANIELTDDEEMAITEMAEHIIGIHDRAERREQNKGRIDKLVAAIKSAFGGAQEASAVNHADAPEGEEMSLTKEDVISAVNEALKTRDEQITSLVNEQKAQGETIKELKANADEQKKAANAEIDEKLKAAGFEDADLEGMSVNAKKKVLAKQQPAGGFHLNTAFGNGQQAEDTNTLPE
ncbi:DUF2213 domain-containing protein [Halomonas caseinilytica]|uniref:DUF2213 domain-containing protein n=1 Tax=Halomonas caseinilytica TaxID=438744 RepID=UPI0007E5B5BE|nr:DUF2213 domain-containing protein [Halomonas caseinilytica]SEN68468.1 hypothetical protein SAMN04487952_12423 [Halomonas caseinilytica]